MAIPLKIKKTGTIEDVRATEAVVKEKVQTLQKLIPKKDTTALAEVELEALSEKRGGYRVEINFSSDGDMFRVEAKRPTIRIALDAALEDLRRELRRRKTKRTDFARNEARRAKNRLKG
ncbi:HPF/RaiA family ribosome-associated protein [Patescibacteria group bacterium]|nr:HPF/RaiA family ribosome-associated protein [Patescibacteria group bacterium]